MPTLPILHQLAVALQRDDAHIEELFYRLNRAMVMDATAARAVHDLRNPLQAIVMAADTLNDKDIDAATVAQLRANVCFFYPAIRALDHYPARKEACPTWGASVVS